MEKNPSASIQKQALNIVQLLCTHMHITYTCSCKMLYNHTYRELHCKDMSGRTTSAADHTTSTAHTFVHYKTLAMCTVYIQLRLSTTHGQVHMC